MFWFSVFHSILKLLTLTFAHILLCFLLWDWFQLNVSTFFCGLSHFRASWIWISQYIIYSLNYLMFFFNEMYVQLRFKTRACFVSSFFLYFSKTPFSIFTSQKIALIWRKYIYTPLINRSWIIIINDDIYQKIQPSFSKYRNFKHFNKIS